MNSNTQNSYNRHMVNCSMEEPLQHLMDSLSSKSSELYIFWQNYNQLYSLYQERVTEISVLKEENTTLKKQLSTPKVVQQPVQDNFLKERYVNLEKALEQKTLENDKLKSECQTLRKQLSHFHEENHSLQVLLQQLREENNIQKQSIEKILLQLKSAQNELSQYSRLYEEVQNKDQNLARMIENEKRLTEIIQEREDEIDELVESNRNTKVHYENLLRESMDNAKNRVMESLPGLMKGARQRVQVIGGNTTTVTEHVY